MYNVPRNAKFHAFVGETTPQVVAVCNRNPSDRKRVIRALRRHGGMVRWTSYGGIYWGVATLDDLA
jgi:hypothetical protein